MIDYAEVPYLQDLLNYLPIDPIDEEDVVSYIRNITNVIVVNFKYGQYQFAYFGVHLLYMTFIYCTIWKISQINPRRYTDTITFARPYNGTENLFRIKDPTSIFSYSYMPEKEIAKILQIIGLDNSQISIVGSLVDDRNDMAHASGKIEVPNEESFSSKTHAVLVSMRNIHRCMDSQIREWYSSILIQFCEKQFEGYSEPKDIIEEQMIQSFKLSVNELLVCNEMSLRTLIANHREKRGYKYRLKKFKSAVKEFCVESGYIVDL